MTSNIKDILVLDDNNEYVVVSKIQCYYLLDKNNNVNAKFGYEINEEFVEIEDKELITKLIPLFLEAAGNEIKN